jgi:hypothetical protein
MPKPGAIIQGRPKAGVVSALGLSLVFALLMTAVATIDQWLVPEDSFAIGEAAPITVRVPHFSGLRDDATGLSVGRGSIVVARGQQVGPAEAQIIAAIYAKRPDHVTAWAAYACAFFLMAWLYTSYLRRSPRGGLLRMQAVSMALTVGLAAGVKLLLLFTSMSIFIVPVATAAVIAAIAVDLYGGLATGLVVGISVALMAPFDAGVVGVLATQGVATVLCIGDGRKKRLIIAGGALGGLAASLTYVVFYYLSAQDAPVHELNDPMRSAWLASLIGGAIAGVLALVALPVYQWLLGEITSARLVELSDLSNPLLKQIAEKSPGTWQHSLAMANMAEIAANAIGANGRLVRVGAYYHDLGKSLQPKYYIENVGSGEQSPHDNLPPEVSCDAIFSHVTEGVRLARKESLPERVVDFMHMHHGDGLLEYFWGRCQEQGNPQGLTIDDFRYPGVRPQTRETAILAICDAVEAASRTLKQPDARAIENLVQRIVYGKLHLGQLDESGLSMADLRKISNSLIETIKHAHHVRVEYPWQREQREAERREAEESQRTVAATPSAQRGGPTMPRSTTTQRIVNEPPLDSLDVPRSYWRLRSPPPEIGTAPTERVDSAPPVAAAPPRPDTEPEVEPQQRAEVSTEDIAPKPRRKIEPIDEAEVAPAPEEPAAEPAAEAEAEPPAANSPFAKTIGATGAPVRTARPNAVTEPPPVAAAPADEAQARATDPDIPVQADPHERTTRPVDVVAPERPTPPPPPASKKQPMAATLPGPGITPSDSNGGASRKRVARSTIELMKSDNGESPLAAGDDDDGTNDEGTSEHRPLTVESHRPQSEDDTLEPGVMVVGPPPKTHTRRGGTKTDDD